jgi:hypothetical protein
MLSHATYLRVPSECQKVATVISTNRWQCFMAQYTVLHMRTPVFVLNSLYDSWQLDIVLLLPSTCAQDPTKCTTAQRATFDGLHNSMIKALTPVIAASGALLVHYDIATADE